MGIYGTIVDKGDCIPKVKPEVSKISEEDWRYHRLSCDVLKYENYYLYLITVSDEIEGMRVRF